jgi:putative hemolysin
MTDGLFYSLDTSGNAEVWLKESGYMRFGTNSSEAMRIDSTGSVFIGDDANAKMTKGLTINQGGADNEILTFKSSDIGHTMTDNTEADTYGLFQKGSATHGSLIVAGYGTSTLGLILAGNVASAQTEKDTGANSPINTNVGLQTSNTIGAMSANGNIFCIQQGGATQFLVDAEGDVYFNGAIQVAFDSYDDAQLVRAMDTTTSPKELIQSRFDDYIKYNEKTLVEAKLMGDVSDDRKAKGIKPLISLTGMQKLHNGAIWQQYTEMQKMKELMYETMVEMIGKDKADEKLKDHDIKLLDEKMLLNKSKEVKNE